MQVTRDHGKANTAANSLLQLKLYLQICSTAHQCSDRVLSKTLRLAIKKYGIRSIFASYSMGLKALDKNRKMIGIMKNQWHHRRR